MTFSPVDQAVLTFNDIPQLVFITVQDAYELLWAENPKLHDLGAVIESIQKYGFQELPKFDSTLGAIKAGNGRVEALRLMEQSASPTYELPRGLAQHTETNAWVMPLLIGTDAESHDLAMAYAIDSNNLTLMGGDFGPLDLLRLWDTQALTDLVIHMGKANVFAVSVDPADVEMLMRAGEFDPEDHWQGMPEFDQPENAPYHSVIVHFKTEADMEDFAKMIRQTVTENTKYIYHPPQEKEDLTQFGVIDES